MTPPIDRRALVVRAAAAGAALAVPSLVAGCSSASSGAAAAATPAQTGPDVPQRPPPLELDRVHAFVAAAHSDLDGTRAMLAEAPGLLNATWDWGGGDFETALGGASHMGRRDIAQHLLDQGARIDLFCAAMMGLTEVVAGVIERYPEAVDWKGPHGISLLRHARMGEAAEVVAYLEGLGAR